MEQPSSSLLIDTHAHLASAKFEGEVSDILARAKDAGVGIIVAIACDLEDSQTNLDLANRYEMVSPTVGVHPLYAHELKDALWIDALEQLAANADVAAIGEIGLDYFHAPEGDVDEGTWRRTQQEVFEAQLQLASDLELPVVVHQRESAADVAATLKQFPKVRAVLHCFGGTIAEAEAAIERGDYVSFTGILTFPKAQSVRDVAATIPLERIMIETDCPYLAPVPYRGKRCEPAMVSHTAAQLAEIHQCTLEEITEATTANAERFFRGL